MSDVYTIITPILAGIATVALSAAGYLWYRQKEIIALSKEVIDVAIVIKSSYEDKDISTDEFSKIIKEINDVAVRLKDVIYKK